MRLRAFVIASHAAHGVLLLRGKDKPKKGKPAHWQLPGGNVDAGETPVAAAVREFREETGIVLDRSRLRPVLNPSDYGGRHYFTVELTDADSVSAVDARATKGTSAGDFRLRLSSEHTSFTFEPDLYACAHMVELHSKGYNAKALTELAREWSLVDVEVAM